MNPLAIFIALYAALLAARRQFTSHPVLEHEALLMRTTAAVAALAHLEAILKAIDQEMAARDTA